MKKKILIVVPSMNGGGSERVMSILANGLDRKKFEVILVLLKKEGEYLKNLKDDLKIVDLQAQQIRYSVLKLYKLIRKEKPSVIFSTLGSLNLILSFLKLIFKDIKFIARESSIVSIKNKQEKYPKLYDLLYRKNYNNFDRVVCQSEFMRDDLLNNYAIKKDKLIVINNPVEVDRIKLLSISEEIIYDSGKINLLVVGRLNKVKGFDLLLNVLNKLDANYHLTILGQGSEEKTLKEIAVKLNIVEKLTFLGFQSNPYKYMKQADLFILSSRYEGFPNVLLEANICGTPVIAFNCPGGTEEIIENGVNGYLVPCGDIDEMTNMIKSFDIKAFDENAIKEFIKKKYAADKIIKKYENVLYE